MVQNNLVVQMDLKMIRLLLSTHFLDDQHSTHLIVSTTVHQLQTSLVHQKNLAMNKLGIDVPGPRVLDRCNDCVSVEVEDQDTKAFVQKQHY